jgi:hypothetical protein
MCSLAGPAPAELLDLIGRCGPRRIAGEPALAGLQGLLRPRVIHALGAPCGRSHLQCVAEVGFDRHALGLSPLRSR